MSMRLAYLLLALGAAGLCAEASAQSTGTGTGTGTGVVKLPQDIEFKGPLTGPPAHSTLNPQRLRTSLGQRTVR